MPKINILSPFVADLIAAGEVVERPGSAVKELMENAIDAGAKNITVELKGGGRELIRVSDDGCGMSPEDAGVAFLRHATSKLRDEHGLESIATLGFRGEALAAISSVSHIELLTREMGAPTGTRVTLDAGDIQEMHEAGSPEGTVISVRDLFFNTPARLKFLKSDRAEGEYCVQLALKCALGRPDVSVRCIRDGKEEFFTPGDGRVQSAVYALLGRETASNMLECRSDDGSVRVSGYISAPHACRGNRSQQYFFVNGRCIRSLSLQAALEQAYKNQLLTGRFPACVLHIELSPGAVDVNVHPTKAEVKFSNERTVFDGVYYAAFGALNTDRTTAEIQLSGGTKAAVTPKKDFFKTMTASEYRSSAAGRTEARPAPRPAYSSPTGFRMPEAAAAPRVSAPAFRSSAPIQENFAQYRSSAPAAPEIRHRSSASPAQAVPAPEPEPAPPVFPEPKPEDSIRIVGEALSTYIIAEQGDALVLIDKHAAHERIIFDRLKAQKGGAVSQSLLVPVTWTGSDEDARIILDNLDILDSLGFEIEPFGERSLMIRAVPADIDGGEAALLDEICEKLRRGESTQRGDEILHTVACKAAIKAGSRSQPEELLAIARRVLSGEIKYCPHGRPVSVTLTKKELDKQFKRIV